MEHATANWLSAMLLLALPSEARPGENPEAGGGEKLSEPDVLDQKIAERAIRKIYQDDYARKTPEGLQALAAKLLGKAKEARAKPAECFVLLREARDLATNAPDAQLALEAVEETARAFKVDRMAMRKAAVSAAAKSARIPDAARSVAQGFLSLLMDAAASDDYEWAKKIIASASALSKTARDAALSATIQELGSDVADAQKRWAGAKSAEKVLAERPDDPEANLTSGKFLCIIKNDWARGLKRLGKGSDSALAKLAQEDLLEPKDSSARLLLGNAWWGRAEKCSGSERLALRLRGALWMAEALGGLDGVERDGILQRFEGFQAEIPGSRLCWQGLETPSGFTTASFNGKDGRGWVVLKGTWKFSGLIASDALDGKDMSDRYIRSAVKANWVYVIFEFKGGTPGLYLSTSGEASRGAGCNLDSEGRYNDLKVDIDMGRWHTLKYERAGEVMKVYFDGRFYHSFSPGPSGYILVKGQRGELRVRKLVGFGFNP